MAGGEPGGLVTEEQLGETIRPPQLGVGGL
jgi:hypothetical protein